MKIKLYHFAILYLALVIFIAIDRIAGGIILLFNLLKLFFIDFDFAVNQLSFSTLDTLVSSLLLIPLFIYFIIKRGKLIWLNIKLSLSGIVVFVLLSFFVFAPIIAPFNPDFQKNISVTKLLEPLKSKIQIKLLDKNQNGLNIKDSFMYLKEDVVLNSFNSSVIFADSIKIDKLLRCYQGNDEINFQMGTAPREMFCSIESRIFLLGTDEYGRDIFSRIIYGTRVSLFIGLSAVLITFALGVVLGFIAGYSGGRINSILNYSTDMFLAFPVIFLIILILTLFGGSLMSVIIVLGVSGWMSLFKIVRSEVIAIKSKEHFLSAKQIGLSATALMKKEIFPLILSSVIVNVVFQFGNVILAESALSYLGLGAGNNYPSWGKMIEDGQGYLSQAWWMIVFPSLILVLTLFSANDIAEKINQSVKHKLEI